MMKSNPNNSCHCFRVVINFNHISLFYLLVSLLLQINTIDQLSNLTSKDIHLCSADKKKFDALKKDVAVATLLSTYISDRVCIDYNMII